MRIGLDTKPRAWVRALSVTVAVFSVLVLQPLFCRDVCWGDRPPKLPEYQVKAAFLFNFAQFVTWPADLFDDPDAPFRIAVLGRDPFGGELDRAVRNKTHRGRPLKVERFAALEQLETCHILFVCESEQDRLEEIKGQLGNQPVLTVGEGDGFAAQGGMIRFFRLEKKIRIEINNNAAEQAGLKISSKLLRLALIHEG